MNRRNVGVMTTHNEPSTLTREEKILRREQRAIQHEILSQGQRLAKLEAQAADTSDAGLTARLQAEIQLARQRIKECEAALAGLTLTVN